MSQAPSTLGIITTSRRLPMAPTSVERSSRHQGESRLLTRVHSGVPPRSTSRPIVARPSRAAIFRSPGMASSRFPRRMSVFFATSGSFAAIFSFDGSKKWMHRDGLTGISRSGSGAPSASDLKNDRGFRIAPTVTIPAGTTETARAGADGRRDEAACRAGRCAYSRAGTPAPVPMRNPDLHGSAPDESPVALLLIDVINDMDFAHGPELLRHAIPMADRIAALKARARRARIPAVYVNDNFGRWQSDLGKILAHCIDDDTLGRPVAERLRPADDDYFVLKPKHSGFYSTTLEVLLRYLGAETLILTGMATDVCVL